MDIFDNRYYKITKFGLSCIGRWSYQKPLKKRIAQILIAFSLAISIIPECCYIYTVRYNFEAIVDTLPPFFCNVLSFSHLSNYIFSDKKIRKLVDFIKDDWQKWKSGMELEILHNYAEAGRFYTILYAVNVYTAVFTVIAMSLTQPVLDLLIPLNETRPRQMVFEVEFPFDEYEHYYWIVLHGSVTGFYNLSILFCCESLFAVFIMHGCGLFATVRYSSALESCYSTFLFCTIGINVVNLSISGLKLLNSLDELDKIIKFGAYTAAILIHLFCLILPPQKLLDSSGEVAQHVYEVCWYKMSAKSKKLLHLLLLRSQEPCKLTALMFYTMDMETFSALLQTSISFFTVMFSMR